MPFTPAHVAAVLPVVGRNRPRWAMPAALVIGSMVPDVLYFVPIRSDRSFSHSLTGLVTLDLALGLAFLALWRWVAAPVVRDLAPGAVRRRLRAPRPVGWSDGLWAVLGVLVGGLTHLVWDGFTHSDGWAVRRIPALTADVGVPVFKLAQYGSGVVGCAVVVAYCLRLPPAPGPDPVPRSTDTERRVAWTALVGTPVVVGLGFASSAWLAHAVTEMLLYVAVVRGMSGLGLAACAAAAWWHLAVKGRADPARVAAAARRGV